MKRIWMRARTVPETAGLRQPLSDHERLSTLGNQEAAAAIDRGEITVFILQGALERPLSL
jgi:hypothetical protein